MSHNICMIIKYKYFSECEWNLVLSFFSRNIENVCVSCSPCASPDEMILLFQTCEAGYVDCDWLCNFSKYWPQHVTALLSRMTESHCHYFETVHIEREGIVTANEVGVTTTDLIDVEPIDHVSVRRKSKRIENSGTSEYDIKTKFQINLIKLCILIVIVTVIIFCVAMTTLLCPCKWHRSKHKELHDYKSVISDNRSCNTLVMTWLSWIF